MIIYKMINTENNKIYVGQTVKPLHRRSAQHLSKLKNGNHGNKELQKDYKHCKQFAFEVLDVAAFRFSLDNLERFWIKHLSATDPSVGYNSETGGYKGKRLTRPVFNKGKKLSEQHRQALINAKKDKSYSDVAYNNVVKVPVVAKNILTNEELKFSTMKDCSKYIGCHHSAVVTHVARMGKLLKKQWVIRPENAR